MFLNLMLPKTASLLGAICWVCLALAPTSANASVTPKSVLTKTETSASAGGVAQARLIEIYRLIGRSDTRPALRLAEFLGHDYPHFALAQLVYADLLSAQIRPLNNVGEISAPQGQAAAWRKAKSSGNLAELKSFYANDLSIDGKSVDGLRPAPKRNLAKTRGGELELKDLSMLHWHDKEETMVVTFSEVVAGRPTGTTKHQHWQRRSG